MIFFPYENFYIVTHLNPAEVQARLGEVVSPDGPSLLTFNGLSDSGANTPFKGSVSDEKFRFKPNVIYSNSFLPQIKGSIEPYNGGSRIHVTMTLYVFVMIFMGVLLTGAGVACIVLFPRFFNNQGQIAIIPYLLFMFIYVLTTGAFKSESLSSKSYLKELLTTE